MCEGCYHEPCICLPDDCPCDPEDEDFDDEDSLFDPHLIPIRPVTSNDNIPF